MTGRALRRLGPVEMERRMRGVWATPLMLMTMAMTPTTTTIMMMMARPPGTAGVASLYSVRVRARLFELPPARADDSDSEAHPARAAVMLAPAVVDVMAAAGVAMVVAAMCAVASR